MNPRVKAVRPRTGYRLEITFSNGEVGIYDCRPLLEFGVFRELKDESYFRQVRAADGTVVWPHEQDICPDTLYLDSAKRHRQRPPKARRQRIVHGRHLALRLGEKD
jgi:hypothetical protein